jgi:hypothetical protein
MSASVSGQGASSTVYYILPYGRIDEGEGMHTRETKGAAAQQQAQGGTEGYTSTKRVEKRVEREQARIWGIK